MAGKIVADQLEHSTAGSLDTQYVVNGSAKAWFNYNLNGTPAIKDSLNTSSLNDDGTGQATVTYTNNISGSDYAIGGDTTNGNAGSTMYTMNFHTSTTSNVQMDSWYISTGNATQQDTADNRGIVMGDLA